MAKQQTEDELNLRRKARRRLVGAVVLTLAVVVILPMVLDKEPKPASKDIDLTIPAPDKAGEFKLHAPVSEVAAPIPAEASAVMASSTPPAVPAMAVPSGQAATRAEISSSPKAAGDKPKKPTPHQSSEPHKSPSAKDTTVETYVAQIGAYTNPDTARQELRKLKKWGFRAYTEKAGNKTRVRVGPYQSRDKAERAAHQLEKHGLHPVIVSGK